MKTKPKVEKKRLDVLVAEHGLAESRQQAQALILAGQVLVNGQKQDKAGTRVDVDSRIEIVGSRLRYASRAGLKLEGALEDFQLNPAGKACLDIGSSTGGFTDCLLQHGARRVYAVDVTVKQLAWKLHQDPRVISIERNARELAPSDLSESVELVTVDVSFISVTKFLPRLVPLSRPGAAFLILIKPQFELERGAVGKGGIVRDPKLHDRAVARVRAAVEALGLQIEGVRASRLAGAEGNQEFFLYARRVSH